MSTAVTTALAPRRATLGLIALSVATFAFLTTEVMPIGLLTLMAADLHRTPAQIGLVVTGYAVVVVLASLPLARVTARVPRRPLLATVLGAFALATLAAGLAPDYRVLFAARLLAGLAQALFWSIVAPTAASLYPPERRGRAVARLAIGTSIAPVLGVPAGTWLGQQAGWRSAFLALAALTLLIGVAVTVLLPGAAATDGTASRGSAPDARRYAILVAATAIAVTGLETAYTYVAPFLLDVSHFGDAALAPVLLAIGLAGVAGTLLIGRFLDAHPWPALVLPLFLVVAALLALYLGGPVPAAAVVALVPLGFGFSAYTAATQNGTLIVAPGSTDLASAGVSSAFNVGIASGSFLGGALIGWFGVRSVALVGGILVAAAVGLLLSDGLLARAQPVHAAGGAPAISTGPAG